MTKDQTRQRQAKSRLPVAGFLSGTLLTVSGIAPILAPVQVFALVPLLLALRRMQHWRECLHAGFLMGLGFVGPQLLWLRLPPAISLVLVAHFVVSLMVLAAISWRLVQPTSIRGCLAFGALLAVFDWGIVMVLPMWGTAQSFVRCWSWYPRVIAFTCITGMTGVMFLLASVQALAVNAVLSQRERAASILTCVGLIAVVALINAAVLCRKCIASLPVAAVGWAVSPEEGGMGTSGAFDRLYAEPVAAAARYGARLIVSPETAFAEYDDPQREPFDRFTELARQYRVYLAVGYLDLKSQENRVVFIGPSGQILGRYTKTHLTPFEDNPTGTGEPTLVTVDGIKVGVMICQDDNYTDISRRYGSVSTGIVVVPTNDWAQVRRAHFQNSIHRAIESRYAVVRAASNGISAIISPTGTRLAVSDHFKNGPDVLVADVPVHAEQTVFSRFGNWFVVAAGLFIAGHLIATRRQLPGP